MSRIIRPDECRLLDTQSSVLDALGFDPGPEPEEPPTVLMDLWTVNQPPEVTAARGFAALAEAMRRAEGEGA